MSRAFTVLYAAGALALLCGLGTPAVAQELTRAPELTRFVEAQPPEGGGAAVVVVAIDIGADGRVVDVSVVESGGEAFDASAMEAVRQFVFTPAEVDGVPAPIRIHYKYVFTEKVIEVPPETVVFAGVVELADGTAVPGASVEVPDLEVVAVTDDEGAFAIENVPLGTYVVRVSAEGFVAIRATVEVTAETASFTVEKLPEGVDEELVIRASRTIRANTRVAINADEARKVAGTQGDTLKVVQALPGVAQSSGGSGALVVWGAAPEDTRVLVDGVEIPSLYHIGGVRSTVNSDLVESISLVPGAFGPAYGRGLGGLVLVETRRLPTDLGGYLAADLYDASGMLSVPLGDTARAGVAGRYGYLDQVFPQFVDEEVQGLFPVPQYRDLQAKVELDLREGEWIGATLLYSGDLNLRRTDDLVARDERGHLAVLVPYERLTPSGASFRVTPHVVRDWRLRDERFGETPATSEVRTTRFGLRADYRESIADEVTVAFGVDGLAAFSDVLRRGSLTRPAREGDVSVFGQPPGDDVSADAFSTGIIDVGVHARAEWDVGPVTLVPGLRADAYVLQGDRVAPPIGETPRVGFLRVHPAVAPRISARWAVLDDLTLHAATGRYHQPPRPEELSAVFGNPTLALSEAFHVVSGAEWKLVEGVDLEATAFYEDFERLVARSPSATPALGRSLTQDGEGRSLGAQFLLRRAAAEGVTGWISYTLARSVRRDHPTRPERLFDFDQTHVLSVVTSYALGDWTLGGRARYATGFPRTPVVGAFYDARGDRFQPRFGAQNSARIPDFFQLDLRLEYAFAVSVARISTYLDVQNVTNASNPEEVLYNYDFTERRFARGLPFLAILGGRVEF